MKLADAIKPPGQTTALLAWRRIDGKKRRRGEQTNGRFTLTASALWPGC
ncbi:hypothetical protein R0381_002684 [Jeongeupia wiesaeckerbachi]